MTPERKKLLIVLFYGIILGIYAVTFMDALTDWLETVEWSFPLENNHKETARIIIEEPEKEKTN